jgi:hypothetical protein
LAKQAVELAPKVANYHNTLGVALKNQNRFEEAIASFQEAIRCEPNFFWPHYNLAWLLATCPEAKFRDPAKAMEFAETAGRLKGNRGWYLRALGAAQYRADQWQAAVESLTEADKVQNGAGLSFYAFFLAMAHGQLGHAEEAHQWLSKAVEWMEKYAKDDPELICFRAEAEALLGNKQPDRRMRSSAGRRHRFLGWPSSPWRIPATFLRLPACGPRTDSCRDSDSSSDAAGSTGETSCVPLDVDWPEFWLRQHFWPPE